jgi:D-alanyl-D-alanine carboxypeptidase
MYVLLVRYDTAMAADQFGSSRPVQLVCHEDDCGLVARGQLIPLSLMIQPERGMSVRVRSAIASVSAAALTVLAIGLWYAPVWPGSVDAVLATLPVEQNMATAFLVKDAVSGVPTVPAFGPNVQLADRTTYEEVRTSLSEAGVSFIDIDTIEHVVRVFSQGVLAVQAPLRSLPGKDSWCSVVPGVYQVSAVVEKQYSALLDVYLPYSVVFHGNRVLHGVPTLTDGKVVPDDYNRDCLRIATESAQSLFSFVLPDMAVVVHGNAPAPKVAGDFAARLPEFSTPYYLIGDIDSDTVLIAGDRHAAVPIASVTKLMTALVVYDTLPLDQMVPVEESQLIESMVPRLSDRTEVSVFTLLSLLLLESSNEAAEVLAAAVGREKFIAAMNERAYALGMIDTVFTDPAGIGATNVSSAHDLWWLMRYLYLQYPFLLSITRGDAPVPAAITDGYDGVANYNLLEGDDGFYGGKIGETSAASQTSVSVHRRTINGQERAIAVVLLGSEARSEDVRALLQYLEERYPE